MGYLGILEFTFLDKWDILKASNKKPSAITPLGSGFKGRCLGWAAPFLLPQKPATQ